MYNMSTYGTKKKKRSSDDAVCLTRARLPQQTVGSLSAFIGPPRILLYDGHVYPERRRYDIITFAARGRFNYQKGRFLSVVVENKMHARAFARTTATDPTVILLL